MISTPDLCDAHEQDITVLEPLFVSYGGREAFGGQIVTVKCFEDNSAVKAQLATAGQGKVLVVDGGGSKRCALLGDMLAAQAAENGWEGVIIYGCVRDVDALAQLDLGVQALAAMPLKSVRKGIGEVGLSLSFGGVIIENGEYIYADNNGVIVSAEALTMPE